MAANPDRCRRFRADPDSDLRYAALSDSEKMAVRSRDPHKISEAIANSNPDSQRVFEWLFSVSKDSED
jgi:hypothetical protein